MRILVLRKERELTQRIKEHFKAYECSFDVFSDASLVFDAIEPLANLNPKSSNN